MSNLEKDIRAQVDRFVNELRDLIRREALDAVTDALSGKKGGEAAPAPKKATRAPAAKEEPKAKPRAAARPAAKAPAAAPSASSKRKAGEKRSPQLLAQITEQVYNYIKSNSNQGVEQMAKALNTSTKELTLPIRKLLADKKIGSKGQKRATRYFSR